MLNFLWGRVIHFTDFISDQLRSFTLHLLETKTKDMTAQYSCQNVGKMMLMVAHECMVKFLLASLQNAGLCVFIRVLVLILCTFFFAY